MIFWNSVLFMTMYTTPIYNKQKPTMTLTMKMSYKCD